MNNKHLCEKMPDIGVYIIFDDSYIPRETPTWCLIIQREANEEDLENNHYLENIGDTLWTTVVEIRHCPYCGVQLPNDQPLQESLIGEFVHIDSQGWKSKRN